MEQAEKQEIRKKLGEKLSELTGWPIVEDGEVATGPLGLWVTNDLSEICLVKPGTNAHPNEPRAIIGKIALMNPKSLTYEGLTKFMEESAKTDPRYAGECLVRANTTYMNEVDMSPVIDPTKPIEIKTV